MPRVVLSKWQEGRSNGQDVAASGNRLKKMKEVIGRGGVGSGTLPN